MLNVDLKKLKPYGDRLDDGAVQLSFTLPVKASPEAREAARLYAEYLNLERVAVVAMEPMGARFTHFVVYGYAVDTIDMTKIKVEALNLPQLGYKELARLMDERIPNPIVVVGACTGSDAHTVGIDAILNMKGFAGDYGLERYPKFKVHNLRAQLTNLDLVDRAIELKADALLVSQVVSQRDQHLANLADLKKMLSEDKRLPRGLITIIGGPRIDHRLAVKLGFDAGFGPGTKPSEVAVFILKEFCERHAIALDAEPPAPIAAHDDMIDEATMEESFTPLVYQRTQTGQVREEAMRAVSDRWQKCGDKGKQSRARKGPRRREAPRRPAAGGHATRVKGTKKP